MTDNNYEETLTDEKGLIKKISALFQNETLSDVQLIVGEMKYFAHKFILSASSDVLSKMFDRKWRSNKKHVHNTDDVIVLEESPECQKSFVHFLKFLYTGQIVFTNDRIIGLLCLADKYNVESLRKLALEYMLKNSTTPHLMNSLKWYSWVKMLNCKEIITNCWETICMNFQKLIYLSDVWVSLEINFLCEILESSSIIVDNEQTIYEMCKTWLYNDDHVDHFEENAERILPLIRFSMMTPIQLFDIEMKDDFVESLKVKKLLKKLIMKAHNKSINETFDDKGYKPRNYLHLVIDKLNNKNSSRFPNNVDKKTVKTPYSSNEMSEWKLTYRKQADKLMVTFRGSDVSFIKLGLKAQFVLIATDENEEVVNMTKSIPVLCGNVVQESLEIDLIAKESDVHYILIIIKMLIA